VSACCDSTVEVNYEADAGPTIARPADHRTDFDLPDPLLVVAYQLLVPPRTAERPPFPRSIPFANCDGTDLYLLTERLRI
jgi:hypothetical protein